MHDTNKKMNFVLFVGLRQVSTGMFNSDKNGLLDHLMDHQKWIILWQKLDKEIKCNLNKAFLEDTGSHEVKAREF